MKFSAFLLPWLVPIVAASRRDKFEYERLDKNDAILLVVDMQEGLYHLARDFDPAAYKQQALAHAALAQAFDLPVVLTTSADAGPNGKLIAEILAMYPDAPLIQRHGEVDAWDSEEFRDAVRGFNKSQAIVAGIATDVCTTHLALSLRKEGYSVWANAEASGTTSVLTRDISNDRMRNAGVNVVSLFSIFGELMRDWRNKPGAKELIPWLDQHFPTWGTLARGHAAAVTNGTLMPGQEDIPF